jgi:hypothetical protein
MRIEARSASPFLIEYIGSGGKEKALLATPGELIEKAGFHRMLIHRGSQQARIRFMVAGKHGGNC